jgi:hypothetical protein
MKESSILWVMLVKRRIKEIVLRVPLLGHH